MQATTTPSGAIGYVRVSTQGQARSGLGLEAQRSSISDFAQREGLALSTWFTETESGAGSDALESRPQLAAAIAHARKTHQPVLVAKLDRLSRNVNFISGLMETRVEFIVTALGRQSDPFVLHLYAALAEKERSLIAERTRAGLQAAKRRGQRLGMRAKTAEDIRRIAAAGGAAASLTATQRMEQFRPHLEFALKDGATLRAATATLNARGIESPRGGRWHAPSVLRAARRLGLRG